MAEEQPYKVIKVDGGEDIICKVLSEFKDAFVVERPMSIKEEPQYHEELGEMVTQTGLSKWINFTTDIKILIPKNKILSIANLAPEVIYFYRNLCAKLIEAEKQQPKTIEEVADRIKYMKQVSGKLSDTLTEVKEGDDASNVIPFQVPDKSKLH